MGTQVFANAARGSLNAAITDVATSITLKSGHGAVFPVANLGANPLTSSGNWFKAVLQDEGGIEIVYVRTHGSNSDTFTSVMRGQEGTTARAFAANAAFGLRMTAADLAALSDLQDGTGGIKLRPPTVTNSVDNWTPRHALDAEHVFESDAYAYQYSVETGRVVVINRSDKNADSGDSGEVGYLRAFRAEVVHDADTYLNDAYGLSSIVSTTPDANGNIQFTYGGHSAVFHQGKGTLAVVYGHFSEIWVPNTGKITEAASYYADLHAGVGATVDKHVALRNKDLTNHVTAQYGLVLYGNSRVGNGNIWPTHALEVAGELDLQPDNDKSITAKLKFSDKLAMFYDASTNILQLNPNEDFAAVDAPHYRATNFTVQGAYGGYQFPNYAPDVAGKFHVSTGGNGTMMEWKSLGELIAAKDVKNTAMAATNASAVSITTTAEIELTSVTFTAKAGVRYLILASGQFIKDSGTTVRTVSFRLRKGTTNAGDLMAVRYSRSIGEANSYFSADTLHITDMPGAGPVTYRLSGQNQASSTVTCEIARIDVIALRPEE